MAEGKPIDYEPPPACGRRCWSLRLLVAATMLLGMVTYFMAGTGFAQTLRLHRTCVIGVAMGEAGVWLDTYSSAPAPAFRSLVHLPGLSVEAHHRKITTLYVLHVNLYAIVTACAVVLIPQLWLAWRIERRERMPPEPGMPAAPDRSRA